MSRTIDPDLAAALAGAGLIAIPIEPDERCLNALARGIGRNGVVTMAAKRNAGRAYRIVVAEAQHRAWLAAFQSTRSK